MCFFKWVFNDCPTKWGKMFQAMDPRASLVSKVSRKNYFSILSFLRSFLSLISKWAVALLFSNVLVNWKLSKISLLDENSGRLITVLVQKLIVYPEQVHRIVEPQRLYACHTLRSRRRLFEDGAEGEISRANRGKKGGVVPWRSNRKKEPTPAMQGFACSSQISNRHSKTRITLTTRRRLWLY